VKVVFSLVVGLVLTSFSAQAQGISCTSANLVAAAFCGCNLAYTDYYGYVEAQSHITVLMCDATLKSPINVGSSTRFAYQNTEESKAKATAQASQYCATTCRL